MKVGDDLASRAREFIATLAHLAPDAALIEVPYPNNRVELRYETSERRTERLTGGVPGVELARAQAAAARTSTRCTSTS